jgi:hypothetical protein
MFNRMNLTLSARSLSNRLNLGTRSLALNTGVNHGGQTLRSRRSRLGVMREGMVWYDVFSFTPTKYGIPPIPGSFSLQQHCQPSCRIVQPGWSTVDVCVELEPRPANLVDRPEHAVVAVGDPRLPQVAVAQSERRTAPRELEFESRFGWKSTGRADLKCAARRPAKAAAAIAAANVGK